MTGANSSAFTLRGVIEGFYGTPWTEAQRLDMVESIGRWGMNSFVYSPKDDYLLRDGWREEFDENAWKKLGRLLDTCRESKVELTVALSPGLSMQYSDTAHRNDLESKLLSLVDAGGSLTRFDGHLSLEVLLPRKDVCDASCETAGVPA